MPPQLGAAAGAAPLEQGLHQIHVTHDVIDAPAARDSWPGDHQRNVSGRLEQVVLEPESVVAERLAVVGGVDEDRVLQPARRECRCARPAR